MKEELERLREMTCDHCEYVRIYKTEEALKSSRCDVCERMELISKIEGMAENVLQAARTIRDWCLSREALEVPCDKCPMDGICGEPSPDCWEIEDE